MKPIRYRKTAKPGVNFREFKLDLDTVDLPLMSVLTNNIKNGHNMVVWSREGPRYLMRLVTDIPQAFFPPELLKPNQELHVLTGDMHQLKVKIV